MTLFDVILGLRREGHKVTTSALGLAASVAAVLIQAGDVRTMGRESYLMLHEASFRAAGKASEMKDTLDWIEIWQERVLAMIADRSRMTLAEARDRFARRTWYLDSDQALACGLVDEVR